MALHFTVFVYVGAAQVAAKLHSPVTVPPPRVAGCILKLATWSSPNFFLTSLLHAIPVSLTSITVAGDETLVWTSTWQAGRRAGMPSAVTHSLHVLPTAVEVAFHRKLWASTMRVSREAISMTCRQLSHERQTGDAAA